MEIPILNDIVIILGAAVVVILLFHKLKVPTIIGFLITGIIAGPYGFSFIKAFHEVEMLAEIGVILLLFIIGLEFSLKTLSHIKRAVFLGGTIQVGLSILVTALLMKFFGFSISSAVFTGFLISLSSTAIGLKLLSETGQMTSPHGKICLAILIFQDIIVIPMMLFTPMLAGKSSNPAMELLSLLLKGAFIIVFVIISARYLVPFLLFQIAKSRSKELFILSIVVICFAVAWLTSSLGLSLALGAFMAGLTISESEYSHEATSNILPFREVFTSFFFISIGMLLDLSFLLHHLILILAFTLLVLILKFLIAGSASIFLGYPIRTSVIVGFVLFQVGEFAFILSETGRQSGLLENSLYQYFLSVSIISMSVTPFLFKVSPDIALWLSGRQNKKNTSDKAENKGLEDHLIIIGYGINGRNVAKAARYASIPYMIVELNAETVKEEKSKGEPIIYGDAVHSFLLAHININKARVVVIAISDPLSTKRIIASIREMSKNVHIIVRTRFLNEMAENFQLGANEVIPEEFETSIEIFTRVLHKYLVPENDIIHLASNIRAGNYRMLRPLKEMKVLNGGGPDLPDLETAALEVLKHHKDIVDQPLHQSRLRNNFGINLVAIKRKDQLLLEIDKDTIIKKRDVLYCFGSHEKILLFNKMIS